MWQPIIRSYLYVRSYFISAKHEARRQFSKIKVAAALVEAGIVYFFCFERTTGTIVLAEDPSRTFHRVKVKKGRFDPA